MERTNASFREEIEQALAVVREGLAMHGGNVELVKADLATGVVTVKLAGACVGCPFARETLSEGVESVLKETVPGVREVRAASGGL